MGCEEALCLAADCNVTNVCVASDCQKVVKNIKEKPRCRYTAVLRSIEARKRQFANVIFRHEGRESNVDAHKLAKFACVLEVGRHV